MGRPNCSRVRETAKRRGEGLSTGGSRSLLYSLLHNYQLLFVGETTVQITLQGVSELPRFSVIILPIVMHDMPISLLVIFLTYQIL